ncbi:MAG TPA: outer membrane beta-barrel protein [Vicinamibacterales bacterium]|nr:outer membrane beta-barrel protein [Vicinamibacterales bacterium]
MASRLTAIISTLFFVVYPSYSRAQTTDRDADIQRRIAALEAQLAELKALVEQKPQVAAQHEVTEDEKIYLDYLHDLKFGAALDTYYAYNFNQPIGRVNLLRAYDVTSNNFSLNQANLIVESAPDVAAGRRFGGRLDFQFGQATETLQGSLVNEPRPYVYRNIFQAYGTYIVPVGSGLIVDFGKWASALGTESNYTKDQMNYSRSYWFNFLPFYHMGARVNYKFNDVVALNYWVTNGTQQTEAFNNFKDQFVGAVLTPTKAVSWNVQYYLGQEHPDVQPIVNPIAPNLPTQPGLSVAPVVPYYTGKLNIFDTYATWVASADTTFVLEGDYVSNQNPSPMPTSRVYGGAVYARQQLTKRTAIAGRAEYLSDHGGLFTGVSQAIKETTVTYDYRPVTDGFLIRAEWRRDFSDTPFFLTDTVGTLKTDQQTATLGVVWWWGTKRAAW